MKYTVEINSLSNFNFWGGALSRVKEIQDLGLESEAFEYIEQLYSDSETLPSDDDINNLLWFDFDDWIEDHKEQDNE